jgi:hypothetical protein
MTKSAETQFSVGQLVWCSSHQFENQNHKMATKWHGPATVIKLQGHKAWIKIPGGKTKQFNWRNIKPFQGPQNYFKQGEGPDQAQANQANQTDWHTDWHQAFINNLIKHPGWGEKEYQAIESHAKHFLSRWRTGQGNQGSMPI